MTVLSLRLTKKELDHIRHLAAKENKKKGEAARSLMTYGWLFFCLNRYKGGKISLESLARDLERSVSETIDLLVEYGLPSPVGYDDYLEASETLQKLRDNVGLRQVRRKPQRHRDTES